MMKIEGKFTPTPDLGPDRATIVVDIFGHTTPDLRVVQALRQTGGSYQPEVGWDSLRSCYHVEANWWPDNTWGDDFRLIERRLASVVGDWNTAVHYEYPDGEFKEGTLIEALLEA
ncbi:MAG TPA: hypothetical protein VLE72_02810 [Candidatus Saccharimonadales bacterium]|nr:hypothetical protein [Candidatus Saccharimonadales bacterium]